MAIEWWHASIACVVLSALHIWALNREAERAYLCALRHVDEEADRINKPSPLARIPPPAQAKEITAHLRQGRVERRK